MILAPNEIAWLNLNIGGWVGEEALSMTAIMLAESGGDTEAINLKTPPNRDLGLGQISTKWNWDKLQKYRWRDPFDNVRMCRLVFNDFLRRPEANGFLAWTVFISGAYLTHIPTAELGLAHPWEPINPHTTAWRR
jgi:hypothetical protein